MNNTIILKRYACGFTPKEYEKVEGLSLALIDGEECQCPEIEEIRRYPMSDEDKAIADFDDIEDIVTQESGALWVEQYVLEYCECDSDGEWVSGSGYAVHDDWKVV